ncbi:hypothetical protein BCL69_100245 [Nitrosomonas communis]|uniref:Uncharacterized protein n=1 Tax=Nitrosomonas communis TaxID=44574 RepID=A0A5D3YMI6_9PROT|nr:hypothetical protein BCL69_100245 [Nitrosomonas communis]
MILIKFYVFIPYFTSGSDWRMAINKISTMGVSLKKLLWEIKKLRRMSYRQKL